MAKDDERPQFNPKHRIAGAIILVSLAVIFVPMLLDESDSTVEKNTLTTIPERDGADTKVVVAPVVPPVGDSATAPGQGDAARAQASETAKAATPESQALAPEKLAPAAKSETIVSESKTTATVVTEKKADNIVKARPVAAKSSDMDKVSKGWMVQVGTFANADNAKRLRDTLQAQGYAVNSESITVQGSKAVRLRVGPYRDKAAASKIQAQLQKNLSIQGVVLAYP